MEYYSQIYAAFAQAEDSDRCRRLKKRAAEFQREFILWFDWEGAALPYGRSLTYRMAQAAFWPASLLSGAGNCDVGEIKGIVNRNIRYWLSKNIFERDGILNVGYAYGNLTMAERYNSPGSPYWSMKIFLILALSDHHPYWSAQEKPFPRQKRLSRLLYAEMLIQQGEQGAFAYVPAVYNKNVLGHFVEKYGKFVYSTKFAFSVAHSCENLVEAAPDSMLAFVLEGEQQVYVRRRSIRYGVETDHIWSEWSPVRGISVRTEIWPVPEGHIRRHKIISDKSAAVFDCGFAVAMYEDGYQTESGNGESFAEVRNPVAGDGEVWLADDTENNRILIFEQENGRFIHTQTFSDIGIRPHYIVYDEKTRCFYALSSMTGELYVFAREKDSTRMVLKDIRSIDKLNGIYVRSFTIMGDAIYFVSGNSTIIRARLSDLKILEEYPVPPEIAGMVQLIKIEDYYYITVSTDADFNQDYATFIRTKDLRSLADGDYEDIYSYFIGGGTPYYITAFDGHYYLTEHRLPGHSVWQFDVEDNEIINVVPVY